MADEKLSLHVDSDWKKQAQEEKRKLAEEAQKAPPPAILGASGAAAAPAPAGPVAPAAAGGRRAARGRRELPEPGFPALVQSMMTQILYYLGELAPQGGETGINLDMAKYQLDMLGMLEAKTANNLTEEEKMLLDTALYETRMRFIGVSSQFTGVE